MDKEILCLLIVTCIIAQSFCKDLIDCREPRGDLFATHTFHQNGPIRDRTPENGLLPTLISCIIITDHNQGSSSPIIPAGGVGQYFVEININPTSIFQTLDYTIQVYVSPTTTNGIPTKTEASTTTQTPHSTITIHM